MSFSWILFLTYFALIPILCVQSSSSCKCSQQPSAWWVHSPLPSLFLTVREMKLSVIWILLDLLFMKQPLLEELLIGWTKATICWSPRFPLVNISAMTIWFLNLFPSISFFGQMRNLIILMGNLHLKHLDDVTLEIWCPLIIFFCSFCIFFW